MIDAELQLEALPGARQRRRHHAGVVDKGIDSGFPLQELGRSADASRSAWSHGTKLKSAPGVSCLMRATASSGSILPCDRVAGRHRSARRTHGRWPIQSLQAFPQALERGRGSQRFSTRFLQLLHVARFDR